jgi:hypothetical protein
MASSQQAIILAQAVQIFAGKKYVGNFFAVFAVGRCGLFGQTDRPPADLYFLF